MHAPLFRGWRTAVVCALVVGLIHPIVMYWGLFSGDAEIHLVYARNLLRGHPLQFNLNEPNSGETSMGYMLVVALIMRVAGAALTPLIMKLLCLACFYATAVTTYLIGERSGLQSPWREIASVLVLWLPGSAYSAMYGTENVLFAALAVFFVYAALRVNWFDGDLPPSTWTDVLMSLWAGLLFWIRPEAGPFIAILLSIRLAAAFAPGRGWGREFGRVVLFGIVFAAAIFSYVVIFRHFAGNLPYGAGVSRRLMSLNLECIRVLGVPIDTKVLLRLASYFSIVIPALVTGMLAMSGTIFDRAARFRILVFSALFFLFMGAYIFAILPAVHFARYSVFLWPFGMLLGLLCLQTISQRNWLGKTGRGAVNAVLCLGLLGTMGYETYLRRVYGGALGGYSALAHAEEVPAKRDEYSAEMAEQLHLKPNASAMLAYQEVQARYELNDNFTVVSLDGITDSRLLRYFCDRWVDQDGYVIDTRVDFLLDLPDYNADKSRWSLASLRLLGVGQSITRPGVIYTKIARDRVSVHRTVTSAAARPDGICGVDTNSSASQPH
jgi:hypothetical protein